MAPAVRDSLVEGAERTTLLESLRTMDPVVAAVAVPLALSHLRRDPAQGSSVLLTFLTDFRGFLIFLGLARTFLT